jgi:amino acid adenylation domain-containing protein
MLETTLVSLFLETVKHNPERPALWIKGLSYSYQNIYELATKVAGLIQDDTSPTFVVYSCNHLWSYIGILAGLFANKAYMPINPKFDIEKNTYMLNLSGASAIIVDESSIHELEPLLAQSPSELKVIIPFSNELPEKLKRIGRHQFLGQSALSKASYNPTQLRPKSYAYLLFTSGTTGIPKGVMVSHANAVSYINNAIEIFGPTKTDKFLQITEITFDLSVHDIFLCWSVGGCLYSAPEKIFLLPDFIKKHAITFWMSVPTLASSISQLKAFKAGNLASIKCTVFCGEPLSQKTAYDWHLAAPSSKIYNLYGPTEATVGFTVYQWTKLDHTPIVKIGKPFQNQSITILDEYYEPVASGKIGELWLSGSQIVNGYWNDEAKTQKNFIRLPINQTTTWYRTGDFVHCDNSGNLIYHGRTDDQFQINGYRVEKLDIEVSLRKLINSEQLAIVPWPVETDGRILGIAVFTTIQLKSKTELIKAARAKLPNFMVPSQVHIIKEFPLNENGKINYLALKKIIQELNNIYDKK